MGLRRTKRRHTTEGGAPGGSAVPDHSAPGGAQVRSGAGGSVPDHSASRGLLPGPPPHPPGAPGAPAGSAAVELRGVQRRYGKGTGTVHALRGIDLVLPHGTFTAVMGPSGSGKSTFLQCAAGLDRPTGGTVCLGGTDITGMSENKLTVLRRTRLGFVFQAFNLMPSLTVEQNVLLPLRLAGKRADRRRAAEVLAQVGLGDKGRRRPAELSGGQQQRVALARALVTRPDVIFADEPTGALDTTTASEVLTLLRSAVDRLGATVVMVTHDPVAAAYADRVLFLADGLITESLAGADADRIAARMASLTRPAYVGAIA
ncbi:ABC transporter ATP-binding protein [Streptomyces sp. NPDC051018]|uniref:ABC transporter ATP-binding protein n=1 Tax=Streptomyces sp. NPDC051018 TaxID=3365639 RepID=UPI0037A5F385